MVVTGLVVTLQPSMTVQEEVKLGGMADALVHHSTRQAVATPVPLPPNREEAGVVPLLHNHEGDSRAVASLKLKAGLQEATAAADTHIVWSVHTRRTHIKSISSMPSACVVLTCLAAEKYLTTIPMLAGIMRARYLPAAQPCPMEDGLQKTEGSPSSSSVMGEGV